MVVCFRECNTGPNRDKSPRSSLFAAFAESGDRHRTIANMNNSTVPKMFATMRALLQGGDARHVVQVSDGSVRAVMREEVVTFRSPIEMMRRMSAPSRLKLTKVLPVTSRIYTAEEKAIVRDGV